MELRQQMMPKTWILFAYIIVLPLASPFGVGIHAGTAPNQFSSSIKTLPSPPRSLAKNRSKVLMQKKDATESNTQKESSEDEMSIVHDFNHVEKKRDKIKRVGSALFYTYVDPLLRISSERELEETDVFPSPKDVMMDKQVPKLEMIYSRCRSEAQHRNLHSTKDNFREKSLQNMLNSRVSKSESLILGKALFLHLKKNIITTGLLRLLNTIIQAFPAILVARLLRLIEAGNSIHPSHAIRAAFNLVAVLSIKMVVENQYFHGIVQCSTMVRGSLSGLIFDKSLKIGTSSAYEVSNNVKDKDDDKKGKKNKDAGTGNVLNLVQSDVTIIENAALQIHTIWGEFFLP